MNQILAEYWILLVIALIVGLIVAWYLFHASRKTRVTGSGGDVLDEGANRAERNNALIDSAPAATRDAAPPPQAEPVAAEPVAPPVTTPAPPTAAEPSSVPVSTPQGLAGTGAAAAAASELDSPPAAAADDLTRIKGVGPKLATLLAELGVTRFAQIAAWDDSEIDRIDAQLGRFQGRVRRDDWVGQAQLLAQGDTSQFAQKYGATS